VSDDDASVPSAVANDAPSRSPPVATHDGVVANAPLQHAADAVTSDAITSPDFAASTMTGAKPSSHSAAKPADRVATNSRAPSRHAPAKQATKATRVASAPPAEPSPAAIGAPALDVVAPPPPPPPPPPTRTAHLASVDVVSGSLSPLVVRRAVDRVAAALGSCTLTGDAKTIDVRFSIGDSRRPEHLSADGSPAGRCAAGVLASVRTEDAPDVGEAVISVRVAFQ